MLLPLLVTAALLQQEVYRAPRDYNERVARELAQKEANARVGNPSQPGTDEFVRHQHNDAWFATAFDSYRTWLKAQSEAQGMGIAAEVDFDERIAKSGRFRKIQCGTLLSVVSKRPLDPKSNDGQVVYFARVLEGRYKGWKIWTMDAVDKAVRIGESMFLLGAVAAKTVPFAFQAGEMSSYGNALLVGDESTTSRLVRAKRILAFPAGTQVTVLDGRSAGEVYLYRVSVDFVPKAKVSLPKVGWVLAQNLRPEHPKWFVDWMEHDVKPIGSRAP